MGLSLLLLLCEPNSAPCQSPGGTTGRPYAGGDKTPLTWSSSQRVKQPTSPGGSPPEYIYERGVKNCSREEVRDVYWPVAGYSKKSVPAGIELLDQTVVPGLIQMPSPTGPLHYGPGTDHYETTAYAPKDGWPSFKLADNRQLSHPPVLISQIQVAVPIGDGFSVCKLHLKSSIIPNPEKNSVTFQYDFSNEGRESLFVFWDIPRTKEFEKQFATSMAEPLRVSPTEPVSRSVISAAVPICATSTVFIFDKNHDLLARGIVGGWSIRDGKPARDMAEEWRRIDR